MLHKSKLKMTIGFTFALSFCLLLLSCVTPCAWKNYECSPTDVSVNDLSKGEKDISLLLEKDESVELAKDQVVKVRLRSNPTTGYTWQVLEKNDEGVISQVGESQYMPGSQAKEKTSGSRRN